MAKRVSKAFGSKLPPTTKRVTPSRGKRSTTGSTVAMSGGRGKVKTLTSEGAKNVGRPGFGGTVPGPRDGKDSVRRVMVRDPRKGITSPAANKITTSKIDLIGKQSPKIVAQPLAGTVKGYDSGRKSIRAPRKSKPVFSNKPGRVSRKP
jgi:hypothetical protein